MVPSRIRDPELAAQVDDGQLAWLRYVTPITEHYCRSLAQRDYRGRKMAYWGHITLQNMNALVALRQAGAEIVVGACNVDSTDDAAAAYAVSQGIRVYGWQGMNRLEYEQNLVLVRDFEADYLCDMGGELIVAYLAKAPPVKGALEVTTSGLNLLKTRTLPFPVFDWNSIPLKDRLENRFHIDIDWLAQQPRQRMKAHIERLDIGDKHLFLLANGSLLNLAAGAAAHGIDMFDHYTAVILAGMAWMFDGIPAEMCPGLQLYPAHLEREIAELSNRIHIGS